MTDFNAPVKTGIPARFLDHEGGFDVGRIRSEVSITAVAEEATDLKPIGGEARGLCPLHDENTPSFFVNEAKGAFHCFGCGSGGDVVKLHALLHGVDFRRACEDLVGVGAPAPVRIRREVSPEEIAVRRVLAGNRAREEWRRAIFIEGTPAERYLTNRGISQGVPGSLRFGEVPRWWDDDGTPGPRHPAMIAALQDCNGRVCGIVRTFVTREGRKCLWGAPRLALGRVRGSAVRLGPVSSRLYVCSGIEDGLALRAMFPGASVWVTPGDGNLPWLTLPAGVDEVVVCGDADASGSAAVGKAQDAFEAKGVATTAMFPKAGAKDFNEEWLLLHA